MNLSAADGLFGKDLAEIDFLVSQTNTTAAGDHDGFVLEGVVDVGQPGVGTGRRLVDLGRTLHVESFVGTLMVEDRNEFVEPGLQLQEVGGRRLGGFFLQGEMHAFMVAILLRIARLDPLDANTEAKPPDGRLSIP